jgi:hypothetical protein
MISSVSKIAGLVRFAPADLHLHGNLEASPRRTGRERLLMRMLNAVRLLAAIIVAKAVLIGLVYWRRAETLGRPLHIGTDSWIGLITIITMGLAIAAGVYVAGRHCRLKS